MLRPAFIKCLPDGVVSASVTPTRCCEVPVALGAARGKRVGHDDAWPWIQTGGGGALGAQRHAQLVDELLGQDRSMTEHDLIFKRAAAAARFQKRGATHALVGRGVARAYLNEIMLRAPC